MTDKKTVVINGVHYDSITGMPSNMASQPSDVQKPTSTRIGINPSHAVHHNTQRSRTLNRNIVTSKKPSIANPVVVKKPVQRSEHITKFGKKPQQTATPHKFLSEPADIQATLHSAVAKTHAKQQIANSPKPRHKTAQEIKHQAISQAMQNAKPAPKHKVKEQRSKLSRFASISSASLAVVVLAGYFTYLNMPTLSVRVAASQAGIDASYPNYHPAGYKLNGPVAYDNGEVRMQFKANSGPQEFTLNQQKSSWDSSALLASYVAPVTEDYETFQDGGLTIYSYNNQATWVNGGILYTVDSSSELSNDQIRRMATSM